MEKKKARTGIHGPAVAKVKGNTDQKGHRFGPGSTENLKLLIKDIKMTPSRIHSSRVVRGSPSKNKSRGKGKKKNSKQAKKGVTTDEGWADRSISYLDQMVESQEYESQNIFQRLLQQ